MNSLSHLAAAALLALLAACSNQDPAQLLGSAKDYLAKGDRDAAVIQLKTALQADPRLAEARWLLGRSLLESGQAQAALIEFDKALEAGAAQHEVLPWLARSLNRMGQHRELVDRYGSLDLPEPAAQAGLKTEVAIAHGALGEREQAAKTVQLALRAQPEHILARLFRARLDADQDQLDQAIASVTQVLQQHPDHGEAWLTLAELQFHGRRDTDAALQAFQRATAAQPDMIAGHIGAMRLLMAAKDIEGAKAQLEAMSKVHAQHPQTRLFQGQMALLSRDLDKARDISDRLLQVSPEHPRVLQLAGAVAFERGDLALAQEHLAKALRLTPKDAATAKLLALVHLKRSQPNRALETLQALLDAGRADAAAWSLAGQAQMMAGDIEAAERHYAQAAKLEPADTRRQTALAVSRLAQGRAGALDELATIASADEGTSADLPLIMSYLGRGETAKALKALDGLEAKLGGAKAHTLNLRARVLLRQRDREGARRQLERAIELDPAYFPAAATLASLDAADNKPELARKRMEAVLAADPANAQALVALSAMKASAGAPATEVIDGFRQAIKHDPASASVRNALVSYHLARNETAAALDAARQGVAAAPEDARMLHLLGRALMAARDHQQAISTYQKVITLQGESASALLQLAEAQGAGADTSQALATLRKAHALDSANLNVTKALAGALNGAGRHDEVLALARSLQDKHAEHELGYAVEGAAHAALKRWPQAIAAYHKGLRKLPSSTQLATRLHAAWMAAGETDKAARWQVQWTDKHPRDAAFHFYLGDQALLGKQLADAQGHYRVVLALQPDNALAMNNIAWLMAKAGEPGALEFAQRANTLLVNRPALIDTLAFVHSREGRPAKAVELLRQALSLAPDDASLRLNLAQALADSGDKTAAKVELKQVLKLGSSFARIDEARALLQGL